MSKSVLLDTSFFLRFLNEKDALFNNANDYYRYFLKNEYSLVISTISIAEYCVKGSIDELPLRNLQILPFNFDHSIRTGKFARILFEARHKNLINLEIRNIIPNDTKLFAQADSNEFINYFLTSDKDCLKSIEYLNQKVDISFKVINLETPFNQSEIINDNQLSLDL